MKTKEKKAYVRKAKDLENCEIGKEVILLFDNSEQYGGFFQGISGDEIILQALENTHRIGLPINRLKGYLERIV